MKIKEIISHMFEQMRSNFYLPVTEHQVYSEQETVVGVWTDEKPLYRKVVEVEFPQTVTSGVMVDKQMNLSELGMVNIDYIAVKSGRFYKRNVQVNIVTTISDEKPLFSCAFIGNGNNLILRTNIAPSPDINNWKAYLVLEYTKTTDTASTAPKVPFEPLIEYSTDEKMIGYWIDGKPLYRKVYSGVKESKGANTKEEIASVQLPSGVTADNVNNVYGRVNLQLAGIEKRSTFPIGTVDHNSTPSIVLYSSVYDTSANIYMHTTRAGSDMRWVLIIEYTKSTDAP